MVTQDLGEVDLRDERERELKRIADRLTRMARDRYNRGIVAVFIVDPVTNFQQVELSVEVPVEDIDLDA